MDIAGRIRSLRKEKNLTLRQLSQKSNVALATLSRIETGRMIGTIESHKGIASALGKTLSQLYSDIEKTEKSIEHQSIKNRTDLFLHNKKASYYMLTTNILSKKMMPVILKVSPGGRTVPEQSAAETEKFIYVLKGRINIVINKSNHALKKGETLYFDASISHYIENIEKEDAQAICVITPPAL
jgi:transcriptional regulator with XRE-family HTH domain